MDYMREYFGMSQASKDNAHDALQDVKDAVDKAKSNLPLYTGSI